MRKNLFFLIISLVLGGMFLTSCYRSKKLTPEEDVRNYGKYFVEKLNANQLDSLEASYPDILYADSIISLPQDTIMVVETAPGQFDVTLAPDVTLKVYRSDDGNISVAESRGLFAFPVDKIDLGNETGMFTSETSDKEISILIKDSAFYDWLEAKIKDKAKNSITLRKGPKRIVYWEDAEGGDTYMKCTLTNTTDHFISGDDYYIAYTLYYAAGTEGDVRTLPDKHRGIDLAPGESKQIELKGPMGLKFHNVRVVYINNSINQYTPTGTEYQEYLNTKK